MATIQERKCRCWLSQGPRFLTRTLSLIMVTFCIVPSRRVISFRVAVSKSSSVWNISSGGLNGNLRIDSNRARP
jgi:hypothetical protein